VVNDIVGDQNFFAAASQKVAGGGVVESAEDRDAREQENVGPVPESVGRDLRRSGRSGGCGGNLIGFSRRGLLSCGGQDCQDADCEK
jgi:hypothetical protein